jgi:hypothetical protein
MGTDASPLNSPRPEITNDLSQRNQRNLNFLADQVRYREERMLIGAYLSTNTARSA